MYREKNLENKKDYREALSRLVERAGRKGRTDSGGFNFVVF